MRAYQPSYVEAFRVRGDRRDVKDSAIGVAATGVENGFSGGSSPGVPKGLTRREDDPSAGEVTVVEPSIARVELPVYVGLACPTPGNKG